MNEYNLAIKSTAAGGAFSTARSFDTLLAALLLAPALSFAQDVTAAITGRVTDPSGGSGAGAKVTAIDTQRGTHVANCDER